MLPLNSLSRDGELSDGPLRPADSTRFTALTGQRTFQGSIGFVPAILNNPIVGCKGDDGSMGVTEQLEKISLKRKATIFARMSKFVSSGLEACGLP